jgi:hypothetical protein
MGMLVLIFDSGLQINNDAEKQEKKAEYVRRRAMGDFH